MDSPPLVSILIVTWNRRIDLMRCLKSALAQSYKKIEIVVIDNASADGTAELLAGEFQLVRVIQCEKNLGCPSGRNLGFTHCQGKYIYMLDDDGWLKDDAVELTVQRAESDETIGVVMSRVHEFADGRVVRRHPAALDQPAYLAGFSGGCSLIRRAALEAAGPFPEDFFRQGEESDLALRLLDAGYFCFLEPASIMFHAPSAVGRDNRVSTFYSLRNTNRTGLRLWPFPWCVLRPAVTLFHALRFMVALRDATLPFALLRSLIFDLRALPGHRRPVKRRAYGLFRKLQRHPSFVRPAW